MTLIKMCGVVILKLQKIERGTKNTMKRIAEMKNKMLAGVGGGKRYGSDCGKEDKGGSGLFQNGDHE